VIDATSLDPAVGAVELTVVWRAVAWCRDWYKSLLGKRVTRVDVSTRLTESPAAVVQSAYGMSPQMQKYYRAQSVTTDDESGMAGQFNQAILELNPSHPIISSLKSKVEAAPDATETLEMGKLVYDVAALAGGYDVDDPGAFSARVVKLMSLQAVADGASGVVPEGVTTRDVEDPTAVQPDIISDMDLTDLKSANVIDETK
jgi:hypothetical protein